MICRVDNFHELIRFQTGTADQAAVDIGLSEKLGGVFGIHGAAVLNGDAAGHPGAVQGADRGADAGADLAGLLAGGGFAGADGPDGS